MNKKAYFGIGGVLIALAALFFPINQHRVISYGVDAYAAHQPIYENRTASYTITTTHHTTGMGVILVDLRRSKNIQDVTITIAEATTGEHIASHLVSKESIRDDEFAFVSFQDTPLAAGHTITAQFAAPNATRNNPIGVRINPENKQLALALSERVPVWSSIITAIQNKGSNWSYIIVAIGVSLLCAATAFLPYVQKTYWVSIALVCALAFAAQSYVIPQFGGVSGGDAYNYLSISDAISRFHNPFENTKRLPGYPLILTPFYASGFFDDQQVMRYIQAISGIFGIVLIAGIARALKLSWPVAIAASTILAFQKDFYFTSVRPEPYTLYTALLLSSLLLFFSSYQTNKTFLRILFGLALGYSAMVRQEGFVLAAVLGVCSFLYEAYEAQKEGITASWKTHLTRFAWMYIPALCIVLPFFMHNFIAYGHPLYTEYFEGDRLQIVDSFLAFQDSLSATWGVIGSMWKVSWENLERLPLGELVFISSAVVLWAWYFLLKKYKNTPYAAFAGLFASVAWVALIFIAVYMKSPVIGNFTTVAAAFALASIPVFIIETKWRGAVVLLVLASQVLIATWFHPFPKHYQQSYPLIVIMIATALVSQVPTHKKAITGSVLATSVLPFFIIAVFLSKNLNAEIDRSNENSALDSVTYRAARAARNLPTPIGFDQAYLPARLYFDPNAKYFPDEDEPTPEMEQEWLAQNPVKTMIVTNGNNVFKEIPSTWTKLQDFKATGKEEDQIFVSTIYSLP